METEDLEALRADFRIQDEDSGSAYEASSAEEQSSSDNEASQASRSSRLDSSIASSSRAREGGGKGQDSSHRGSPVVLAGNETWDSSTNSQKELRQRAAAEWAANFQPPQSPTEIKSPTRHYAGTQSKRKADKPPSEVRAKRLRAFYNNRYRELLNVDIHEAVTRSISDHQTLLETSQIGSSVWTSKEKDLFFSALSRLGRDDVGGIACRVGSKSELEAQEYIHLLHRGMMDNLDKLMETTEISAAVEVSDECCSLLERAGDALASRQECAEEQFEKEKWGGSWLLTSEVSKEFERQRNEAGGRKEIAEFLPAVNLFHLKNWLELAQRVFMNPDAPREEDNWELLADSGEAPSIRATAYEDFHSLAVSFTKRLISTTLFCTTSRQRSTNSTNIEHAGVTQDDVQAAVRILGLKANSKDFWVGCARRCNLRIFDDEWNSYMGLEEVEHILGQMPAARSRSRSRSRSMSRREPLSGSAVQSEAGLQGLADKALDSGDDLGDADSIYDHDSDFTSSTGLSDCDLTELTDSEATTAQSRRERLLKRVSAKKALERAQEKYIEAFDNEAACLEEQRLWILLSQTAPFEIKSELADMSDPPKGISRDDSEGPGSWRDNLEYWSQWETLDAPVPSGDFERNRKRKSKRAMWKRERARSKQDRTKARGSIDNEDGTPSIASCEDRDKAKNNTQDDPESQEYSQDLAIENQEELENGPDSENEESDNHENTPEHYQNRREDYMNQEDQGEDEHQASDRDDPFDMDSGQTGNQSPVLLPPLSRDLIPSQPSDDYISIKNEYDDLTT